MADLSCRELDRLVGSAEGHVNAVENAAVLPAVSMVTVAAWAEVFGVTIDWLVCGRGARPDAQVICASVRRARHRLLKTGS